MGRGRPREFDEEHALDAAIGVFWSKGYDLTSIADLADATGLGPSSLYNAFGCKEAIFEKAMERYVTKYGRAFREQLNERGPIVEVLVAALHASAESLANPESPGGCAVACSASANPGAAGEITAEKRRLVEEMVFTRIIQAIDRGEARPDADARGAAMLVTALLSGMSQKSRDGGMIEDLHTISAAAEASLGALLS